MRPREHSVGPAPAGRDWSRLLSLVLYMFIHRWMVEGLATGSVKG
jgi:hypothetical protein